MSPQEEGTSRLKRIRDARGLSQPELAVRSGVSVKTIGRIEAGERARRQSVRALAKALNVTAADLGYDADSEAPTIEATLSDIQARLARIEQVVNGLADSRQTGLAALGDDILARLSSLRGDAGSAGSAPPTPPPAHDQDQAAPPPPHGRSQRRS